MYKRIAEMFFAFCLLLGVLLARLVIINSTDIKAASKASNSMSITADISRGTIYDCNMQPLVNENKSTYIAVKPSISALSQASSVISPEEQNKAYERISGGKIGIVKATSNFSNENAVTFTRINRYQDDGLCVHLIGYTDADGNGVSGIEKYYNDLLKKSSGTIKISCPVDAKGNILAGGEIKTVNDGYGTAAGLMLTVDKDIQTVCEKALSEFSIEKGAIVVLDVKTSEIKAMASAPRFNQNAPAESLNDENGAFINRAITPYSVGSVFKPITAAAAIENGIPQSTELTCTGYATVGLSEFGCHNRSGHGTLNMYSAMAQSCNPYFINLAIMTGKESICSLGENLGLGKEIELCDGWLTQGGIMPSAEEIMSSQDLANLSFGQGRLLASPLQMTAVYAAIANGGVYRAPSLMRSIIDKNRLEYMRAQLPFSRRVMTEETAQKVGELLNFTTENGSASKAKPDNMRIAGKTATAQSGQFDSNGNEITQSWFCGYFPYENPKYAVTVLKENGMGGSSDCAPVFKYIAENIK